MTRNLQIGIKKREDVFKEIRDVWKQADRGEIPEIPVERLYFEDLKTLLKNLTPLRMELLEELRRCGPRSINALAKQLHRHYKNVYEDVRALERLGLIEQNSAGLYAVPWDEVVTTIKLAA